MKIKHIIIHNIEKEVGMPPKIQYSEHEMDLFDNKVYTLISNLYDFFSRTIKYGIFSSDADNIFHSKFNEIAKQNIENDMFIEFSREVIKDLKSRMESIPQSKGGYVIFTELDNNNNNFFVVFVVRDKTSPHFSYKNKQIQINESIHINTDKLAMACRINIDAYKNSDERYLSFLSVVQQDASKYFIDWIGAIAQQRSTEDTKAFKKIINNVDLPKDDDGQEIPRERLRKMVFDMCSSTGNINLKVVSEAIWKEPDYLSNYAEKNSIVINDDFVADKKVLKTFIKYFVSNDDIRLEFPSDYMGSKIRLDNADRNIIIIESTTFADKFREELEL
jgi:hypothetical protein